MHTKGDIPEYMQWAIVLIDMAKLNDRRIRLSHTALLPAPVLPDPAASRSESLLSR